MLQLTANVNIGSAKTVPKKQQKQHEPDVVFKISGSEDNQRVRLVGELKFSRTCHISRFWGEVEMKKIGHMRHVFARATITYYRTDANHLQVKSLRI